LLIVPIPDVVFRLEPVTFPKASKVLLSGTLICPSPIGLAAKEAPESFGSKPNIDLTKSDVLSKTVGSFADLVCSSIIAMRRGSFSGSPLFLPSILDIDPMYGKLSMTLIMPV